MCDVHTVVKYKGPTATGGRGGGELEGLGCGNAVRGLQGRMQHFDKMSTRLGGLGGHTRGIFQGEGQGPNVKYDSCRKVNKP